MMVAAVDQRDADRRAGKPVRRFQPAEAGADDHHAMGYYGSRLRFGHGFAAFGLRFLRAWYVSVWTPWSKAVLPSPVFQARFSKSGFPSPVCQSIDSENPSIDRNRQRSPI